MAEAIHPLQGERESPAVPRQWIGVPDTVWNPTLSLMAIVAVSTLALAIASQTGHLSLWIAIPGLTICYYVVFTVLHESMHGIAHRNRRVNAVLGRIAAFPLMVSHPLFKAAHQLHHSHTNDPARDPDLIVARRPGVLRPLWLLLTPINYRVMVYGRGMLRRPAARVEAIVGELALAGVIAGAAMSGHFAALLQIWLIPASLAVLLVTLAFDLIPHHPHTTCERYYDTRIYPSRILNALLLGQNYHLIHHLWTTVPWFHYQRVFHEVEADLRVRGAPIGWQRLAERPGGSDEELRPAPSR
jgi:beta-carotene hydroxylase